MPRSLADSGSSILGDGIREDTISEALYATIPDMPSASAIEIGGGHSNLQQSRSQPLYAIPSMTSPPPTYDIATAKTRQVRRIAGFVRSPSVPVPLSVFIR